MSLILAVEPDRRQAKQLSALVRQHVRAELVVADSGSGALAALKNRIPDLILTPPLLPPKDEAVLTGWLRDLGDAGAHVQTLAIPILADPDVRGKDQGSSIFGRLRDQHPGADSGCDPGVFAEQVRVYLDRAATERSDRAHAEPAPAPAPPPAPVPAPAPLSVVEPMAAAAEESTPETEEFDDMTFEDLVFEPGPNDPAPAPAPLPVAEPPMTMRTPTAFARPEKRVDPVVLRSWEEELGLDAASPAAPPLWRAGGEPAPRPAGSAAGESAFDPNDSRYAALFRRLDDLAAAAHA